MIGEAGRHLAEIEASEGAAGNVSVCLRWPVELRTRFPLIDEIELPQAVPELAGATFIVSGSGRRLREIIDEPTANLDAATERRLDDHADVIRPDRADDVRSLQFVQAEEQ